MERKNAATVYLIVIQAVIVKDRYNKKVTKDRNKVILVKLFLLRRHVYTEDLLHLSRQGFFHIFLDTSEKERLKDFVKTLITVLPPFPMLIFKILPIIYTFMYKLNLNFKQVTRLGTFSH